jgi:hypothetical protein
MVDVKNLNVKVSLESATIRVKCNIFKFIKDGSKITTEMAKITEEFKKILENLEQIGFEGDFKISMENIAFTIKKEPESLFIPLDD